MRTVLAIVFGIGPAAVGMAGPPAGLVVELNDTATATGTVRVADVATVRGGSVADRNRITALDLTEMPKGGKSVELTRRLVEIRLRLAGWDGVTVTGPERTTVASADAKPVVPTVPAAASTGPVLVRARQRVVMTVRIGAMTVSAIGEATEAGRLGQSVKLKNVDSQKLVTGTVVGPGAVDVEPGGGP